MGNAGHPCWRDQTGGQLEIDPWIADPFNIASWLQSHYFSFVAPIMLPFSLNLARDTVGESETTDVLE
jgi:hypothetical protein